MYWQAYKRETLGQEALLREKEEAILMERKRRYGALSCPHFAAQESKAASSVIVAAPRIACYPRELRP